ncbi:MAG: siroheme synthase, partial [Sphingobacteriales bacterium]
MDFLPVSLKLARQRCLIVGGGSIAWRKAQLLAQADACIDVLSPEIDPQLLALVETTHGQHINDVYSSSFTL